MLQAELQRLHAEACPDKGVVSPAVVMRMPAAHTVHPRLTCVCMSSPVTMLPTVRRAGTSTLGDWCLRGGQGGRWQAAQSVSWPLSRHQQLCNACLLALGRASLHAACHHACSTAQRDRGSSTWQAGQTHSSSSTRRRHTPLLMTSCGRNKEPQLFGT